MQESALSVSTGFTVGAPSDGGRPPGTLVPSHCAPCLLRGEQALAGVSQVLFVTGKWASGDGVHGNTPGEGA